MGIDDINVDLRGSFNIDVGIDIDVDMAWLSKSLEDRLSLKRV